LTPKEFDLLALLVRNPGRAFSRDYLIEKVWGYDAAGSDRTVDTHVLRLRRKLGAAGDRIETVWGVGYRLARVGAA
jgi:DNA-binding response OmpR family regulator